MKNISERSKVLYLILFIFFITIFGIFWMDYIGLLDIEKYFIDLKKEPELVVNAKDDEPSLIEREEFEKEKQKIIERTEDLDKREAVLAEKEKDIEAEKERLTEINRGLALEKKKLEDSKNQYSGYRVNVKKLAEKISAMPPDESVKIMVQWEDPLIIDVLRQMDSDAENAGKSSITSYLITLMPKEKAGRIMYLMTQL